jgi:hypothetical protein
VRVEVFAQDQPPAGISKLDCLAALFTHGLKAIVERSLFRMKPDVVVRGAARLSQAWGGYERDLLTLALARAGAKRVLWTENESSM